LSALPHGAVARRLRRHRALPGMLPRVARRAQRQRPRILRQVACSPPAWLVVYAAFETLVAFRSSCSGRRGRCRSRAPAYLVSLVAREMPQLSFLRLQLQRLHCISACKKGPVEVASGMLLLVAATSTAAQQLQQRSSQQPLSPLVQLPPPQPAAAAAATATETTATAEEVACLLT
jgi:hypothetical protein